jgi:hypothetical protein
VQLYYAVHIAFRGIVTLQKAVTVLTVSFSRQSRAVRNNKLEQPLAKLATVVNTQTIYCVKVSCSAVEERQPQDKRATSVALVKALAFLAMTFLIYSTASTVIFQIFACDTIPNLVAIYEQTILYHVLRFKLCFRSIVQAFVSINHFRSARLLLDCCVHYPFISESLHMQKLQHITTTTKCLWSCGLVAYVYIYIFNGRI